MNGVEEPSNNNNKSTVNHHPQPAPRQSINSNQQQPPQWPQTKPQPPPTLPKPTSITPDKQLLQGKTQQQENVQVPKPITNEDFQAMIPAHFLRQQPPQSSPSPTDNTTSH